MTTFIEWLTRELKAHGVHTETIGKQADEKRAALASAISSDLVFDGYRVCALQHFDKSPHGKEWDTYTITNEMEAT